MMTENEVIKAIDKVINREYPEDVVPTAVCTIEFFMRIRDIIDGWRKEASYFEDRIDDINREHHDTICELRGEIKRLKKYKNLYEALKAENLETIKAIKGCKAEAIKEFAERLKEKLKEECSPRVYSFFEELIDNLVKEMTEERK